MTTLVAPATVVANRVSWTYSGRGDKALRDISFQIEPGDRVLIQGDSGSGKSTLALLLVGLLEHPDDGQLEGVIEVGSRSVGFVMQQPDDQTVFSRIADDVAFGLENTGVDPLEMDRLIQESLHVVGLELPTDRWTRKLSGGQRQRLALAGALAMKPGLLVLDEPTSALDREGQSQVIEAVASLIRETGVTLIVIDHNPELWCDLVNRVYTLDQGTLLESKPQREATRVTALAPRTSASLSSEVIMDVQELVASRDGKTPTTGPHSFTVRAGEVVALMGPNGSGKTTLAMTLAGVVRPFSGHISTPEGIHSWSSKQLSGYVGVVPQNPAHLFHAATVEAELALSSHDEMLLEGARTRWNLTSLLEAHPMSLSGGEQRRLALAIATVNNPRLLVLDEPSQALDEPAWKELVAALEEFRSQGIGIVMATHDDRLVETLGARVHEVSAQPLATKEPQESRPSPLDVANPLALVGAGLLPAVALLTTLDVVSAATALVLGALVAPWLGIQKRGLGIRLIPVLLAAVFAGLTISLYGEASGVVYFTWGLVQITEGSLELSLATTLRILAIGGPAVLLLSHVDPTRFADALTQQAKLPGNFVFGGLAAFRLFDVVAGDIQVRAWMARARGLGDKPAFLRVLQTTISVLVLAIKRSETLARAMQARGFGGVQPRTFYRPSAWKMSDTLWVVGGAVIGICAVGVALVTGNFNAIIR